LIASADVVLENFRPGVMDRLGLGYAAARALNPLIIYCSLTGYGQDGPMRDYPAIDNVVQAAAGVMSVSGEAEGPPIRMGVPVVDTYAGTLAALAIVSALLQRSRFGGGQRIDVAMFDAALVFLTAAVTTYLVKGEPPPRTGNVGYSAQPTAGLFRCGDGRYVSLGVVRQGQFETLCRVLDQQNLVADPRFADVRARRAHAGELAAILQGLFLTRPSEEWETRLSAVGCPCGVVRDVGEACELGQVSHRGLKLPIRVPGLPNRQDVHVLNAGFRFAHDGPHVSAPPPRLGEHTEAVLAALGLPPHA
jgi:crotonobetainyl-CoA:carnitine CoA-transferase CaiB-like acyl-CoA transferase